MDSVGSYDAKTHLPRLLERVARGERITITRHGVAVAMLVPIDACTARDPRDVIEDIHAFRKGRRLDPDEARRLIDEGRRF